jgi:hypothetical protein
VGPSRSVNLSPTRRLACPSAQGVNEVFTVTASLGNDGTAHEQPWSGDEPLLGRFSVEPVRAAHITDGGKASREHAWTSRHQ